MAVNAAGNYTKPKMRKALFNRIKAANVQGTAAGKWSARKAQLLAKRYKVSIKYAGGCINKPYAIPNEEITEKS